MRLLPACPPVLAFPTCGLRHVSRWRIVVADFLSGAVSAVPQTCQRISRHARHVTRAEATWGGGLFVCKTCIGEYLFIVIMCECECWWL
jgi:hypothetical protein